MSLKAWKITTGGPGTLQALEIPPEIDSFNALGACLPQGAYTTLRTFEGEKALKLEAHFQRLEDSAALVGKAIRLARVQLRQALREAIRSASTPGDLRIRLMLDLTGRPGEVYIATAPLRTPPPQAYQKGVWAVTTQLERQLPKAKLTAFIAQANQLRQALPPGAHEAIMVDAGGQLLEGLSSNFFAVKAGAVWTADEGALSGTTRALALEEIERLGIPLRLEGAKLEDLPRLQEAFISSASRALLPVRQIDEQAVGDGRPGEITHRLMAAYRERVTRELQEI